MALMHKVSRRGSWHGCLVEVGGWDEVAFLRSKRCQPQTVKPQVFWFVHFFKENPIGAIGFVFFSFFQGWVFRVPGIFDPQPGCVFWRYGAGVALDRKETLGAKRVVFTFPVHWHSQGISFYKIGVIYLAGTPITSQFGCGGRFWGTKQQPIDTLWDSHL